LPKDGSLRLYEEYLKMEKQHGDRYVVDDLVMEKRAKYYKQILDSNPKNYDIWIDLLMLELKRKDFDRIRETFESAVEKTPPGHEKRFWKRYIYIWILWITFEELDAKDLERTKKIYERVLAVIPHKEFSFSKIWIMYSHYYVRCGDLEMARKVFGNAIGKCPKDKLFKAYIQLEMQLANFDRCRKIYERYLYIFPDNPTPWIGYAELECVLEEFDRARS
jgi:crooked neck